MKLQLITLQGLQIDEDVYSVTLPTMAGEIGVLGHHEPLLSALKPGVVTIRRQAGDPDYHLEHYATYGGVVEVADNQVRILVDEADLGDEINEHEASAAREEAERLKATATTQHELAHAQSLIDRYAVRVKVSQLRHRARQHRRD